MGLQHGAVVPAAEGPSFAGTAAIRAVVARSVATRPRRWLIAVILLVGLSVAVALTTALRGSDLTFAAVAGPVQLLMSVLVPLLGVVLADDLRRAPGELRLPPTLLAAALLATAIALFGVLVSSVALALASPAAAHGPWRGLAVVAMGSVLVQVVAQCVGTGMGLLLRPRVVAFLATIVLPLGLWFVLGAVDVLRPTQAWLTPFPVVERLLSGRMDALAWLRWFAVVLVWAVGLNALGAGRLDRRAAVPTTGAAPGAPATAADQDRPYDRA